MEQHSSEPTAAPVLRTAEGLPVIRNYVQRHDGWTGEKIAIFCETLAETAVVAEACEEAGMGISGAYAARRRNPLFAAAWEAALTIARERLADTLLARAMEGNVEQIWRNGEVVGERHVIDNRLGLAILRRLDRLAETGLSLHTNPTPARAESSRSAPVVRPNAFDWGTAVEAFRTGDDDAVAEALALVESNKVEEVEDSSNRPPSEDEDDALDLSDRCWKDGIDDIWMTDFPPPAGFAGYESRPYDDTGDDEPYVRACTDEEVEILEADVAADRAIVRAEEEQLRDAWFEMLRDQAAATPACLEDEGSLDPELCAADVAGGFAGDELGSGASLPDPADLGRDSPAAG